MICDGCNVREPHKHHCQEDRCTVCGEPVKGTCTCPECHSTVASIMHEDVELNLKLERERERKLNRLLDEMLAVIHGDGGHHRIEHGYEKSVEAALDIIYEWKEDSDKLKHARAALRHISRTCVIDPETASFARAASFNPPTGFAPDFDYRKE